jgi:hypothetical protein
MKQSISKFIGILLFALVLVVMGQAKKADAATYQFLYGFLTVNLDKAVYNPGEAIQVATNLQTSNCGNHSNHDISLAIMQVVSPDYSYTGTTQKVIDHGVEGSAAAHDSFFANATFTAPPVGGKYNMNTLFTFSYLSGGIIKTRKTINYVFQNPFIVTGCATPAGYTKCSNENETCSFPGDAKVAYGCSPSLKYKDASNSIVCSNDSFGGDPLPDIAKSCFYKSAPGIRVWLDNVSINDKENTYVNWEATGLDDSKAYCYLKGDTSGTHYLYPKGKVSTGTLTCPAKTKCNTTFEVICTDDTNSTANTSYYYKLAHCTSSNVFQTGPFPSGTYSTGEVLAGALDNGTYDYRVVDSSPTPFAGIGFISGTSRTGGYVCRTP